MNGTLVLVAAALSVVLAAGMAPAFAYYPVNDFNDEVVAAPIRIPVADSTYDFDYDNSQLLINYSGFTADTEYTVDLATCADDGDTLVTGVDIPDYTGDCDIDVFDVTTNSTGHLSFNSTAADTVLNAGEGYFVNILVGPSATGFTHNAQFIITIGATSADGVTVVYAPIGATGVGGRAINQHDLLTGTPPPPVVGTQFFTRTNTAGQLLISDPASPATTPFNARFRDLIILEKPEDNSIDPILSIDRNGIRYGTDINTTPQLLTFTVASAETGMRSNPAQLSIQVFPNTAPDTRASVTRNVDHNGTVVVLLNEPHRLDSTTGSELIVTDAEEDRLKNPVLSANPGRGTVEFFNGTDGNGIDTGFTVGFTYTHNSPSTAPDSFTFSIEDEHGLRSGGEVTMTITVGGTDLIQVRDFDFGVLKGATVNIPLNLWITSDPGGNGKYASLVVSAGPDHGRVAIEHTQLEELVYEHDDTDATTDTFTFSVRNSESIRTGNMTAVVTIFPELEGNDFESTVYNQGDTIEILFNRTVAGGGPMLNDYDGFIEFKSINVDPDATAGSVNINDDNDGITYVHDGTTGTEDVVDTFTFTVTGEGSGNDYTSNEITATINIIAPSPPSRDNSTITISPNTEETTKFLFADILTDPNIDPDSGDPLPIAVVERDLDVAISDPEFIYPMGQEGTGVPIGLEYTPTVAAIENGTDVIRFTITDEDGLKSTIEYRVEFGSSGGGDDDQQWKRKPTFGESHLTGALIVENGFSFNGNRLDITDNWHTDFARTSSIIGEHNTVTIKTYANDPLRRVSLSLAIPEIGALHDAETDIHVMLQRNYSDASGYNIINVMHEQKEQLVNATHTTASIGPAKCTADSEDERCYEVEISFVVTAPLKHDVVAITAVDSKRYSTTTYINEGVVFEGDALLPAHTHQMTQKRGNQHPAETIQLTQQDRRFELWEDQHGLLWTKNTHGTWMRLTHPDFERPDDPEMSIKTRLHSDFASMVQYERDRALLIFDSASISSEPDEPFTYEYRLTPSKLSDPEILERMRVQSELAELTYGGN